MINTSEIIPEKLDYLKQLPDCSFVHSGKRILIFVSSSSYVEFFFLLSTILVHRGCMVDLVWSPHFIYTDDVDKKQCVEYILSVLEPIFGKIKHPRLNIIDMRDVPMSVLNDDLMQIVQNQSLIDTGYLVRKVRVDIHNEQKNLYCGCLHRNHETMAVLLHLCEQNKYDSALTYNGAACEQGIAYRLMKKLNIPICTIEHYTGDMKDSIRLSWKYPIAAHPQIVTEVWDKKKEHIITERTIRCCEMIDERYSTNVEYSEQPVRRQALEKLKKQLKIDDNKPIILIMTGMPFEYQHRVQHYVFKDAIEWFEQTVLFLANREDCQVIIRSHPNPSFKGKDHPLNRYLFTEMPEELIKPLFDELPKNFRFVKSADKVNTYDLLDIGHMGLVYCSATGLELAVRGKMAIVSTSCFYNDKGFTFSPRGKQQYFDMINEFIKQPEKMKLSEKQIGLAKCFIEMMFFDIPVPFPWNERIRKTYKKWPIERTCSLEGILSAYMDTVDYLVNEHFQKDQGRKLKEFNDYLNLLQDYKKRNMLKEAKYLLGNISRIDLNYIQSNYPLVYNKITLVMNELLGIENYKKNRLSINSEQDQDDFETDLFDGITLPQLIRSIKNINIIEYGNYFYAVPQQLGPLDLKSCDISKYPSIISDTNYEKLLEKILLKSKELYS